MPDISFTGIGSGLQVSEIVNAIVGAERAPFESRLNQQQGLMTTDISAMGSLRGAIESVSEAIEALADPDEYHKHNTSGNNSFVSVTTTTDVEVGSYSIQVDALAKAHKLMSASIDSAEAIGDGTLTFNSGANNFDIVVSDTATLGDIRDSINDSADNESVIATIITDGTGQRLILTSKESGVDNAITVTANDLSDGNHVDNFGLSRLVNLTEVNEALDAQITIDGVITVTSSSNEFNDVIDGVNISAQKIHDVDDDIAQINIVENNNNVAAGLNKFITSYNELVELSNSLGRASEDGAGPLAGDSLLRGFMGKIRQELSTSLSVNGSDVSLLDFGVETDRYGVLSLDSEVLDEYVDANIDDVESFFIGTEGAPGFAASLQELTGFYTDSGGIIQGRIDSKENQLSRLDDDRIDFERKMESLEARLFAQYNAMDLLVSGLNATSSYLMAQLDNMPGVVKQDK